MRLRQTTWRQLIEDEMNRVGDSFDAVEKFNFAKGDLDTVFDGGYGTSRGSPFLLWTKTRVYFPVVYDGAEWAGSVPRNPCDDVCEHHGGE